MSPVEIECALHYYAMTDDWTNGGRKDAPVFDRVMRGFVELDLLKPNPAGSKRTYEPTERLQAYVKYLKAVPLPVEVTTWELPKVNA